MRVRSLAVHGAVAVAFLTVGLLIAGPLRGSGVATSATAPAPSVIPPSLVTGPSSAAALDVATLRRELRTAVRDQLAEERATMEAAAKAQGDPEAAAEAARPAPIPPTPAQAQAAARIDQAIDHTIERGQLDRAGADALRADLAVMHPDDAFAARLRLAQAVNTDRLHLDSPDAMP